MTKTKAPDDPQTELIHELLRGAAAAHGVYEENELGGVYDEEWPTWYAAHMSRALAERGWRIVPSES